jgi:ribonucleoside-diphosphate reductase alpha chain
MLTRRHGMGITGLGSALVMLGMRYGSNNALWFVDDLCRSMAVASYETGIELAREKGIAPALECPVSISEDMLKQRPEMANDNVKAWNVFEGRVLMARYSRYMQQFPPEIPKAIEKYGCRFSHATSIAPTGTISLSFGNNCSNGIEPSFAHQYTRNIIREGKKTKEAVEVYSAELLAFREQFGLDAPLPDTFMSADDIAPEDHIRMQAAAQKWIDSSISKTINVPTDFPFERFQKLYRLAYVTGCKGCTTFRFNPAAFQGVLVKSEQLENTHYRFTLEDGQVIDVRGDEEVEYDGEKHTSANLFDALKEGYYGRL